MVQLGLQIRALLPTKGIWEGGQEGRSRSLFSAQFYLENIFIWTSNFETDKWLGRRLEGAGECMTRYFTVVPSYWILPSLSLCLQAIPHGEEGGLRKLKVAQYRMCYSTEKQTSDRLEGHYKYKSMNFHSIFYEYHHHPR